LIIGRSAYLGLESIFVVFILSLLDFLFHLDSSRQSGVEGLLDLLKTFLVQFGFEEILFLHFLLLDQVLFGLFVAEGLGIVVRVRGLSSVKYISILLQTV
jgi:hypothetical protein